MNYILFDDGAWGELLPLTFTRPVAEVRVGILTIREKWELLLKTKCSVRTQEYLARKFPLKEGEDNLLINGSVLPTPQLLEEIEDLGPKEALCQGELLLAVRLNKDALEYFDHQNREEYQCREYQQELIRIGKSYHIFSRNDVALRDDFELLTNGRTSEPISETVNVLGRENIFIEEGATVEFATLNATKGPVYIGRNAEVMEGSMIRGPFALGEHSVVNMGAKVYGPTTLGPYCKCGGELNNVVLFGYSNKAHDGFLGNAVIGEWCNIGADTNNSNLKNNYSEVKLWNYQGRRFERTGLQFCGTVMGDHSKVGINTMLNTGTVIGVSSNVFGAGFPRNFIPSFAMGGGQGFKEYRLKATFEVAQLVMKRRNKEFDEVEKDILTAIFDMTKENRNFI
ncbi:MAG: GlmU family protein [Marinifilaceae bacterium]